MNPSRRQVLAGGCAAMALLAVPSSAEARKAAPRFICHHQGCRHHRPDSVESDGICGLALHREPAFIEEVFE